MAISKTASAETRSRATAIYDRAVAHAVVAILEQKSAPGYRITFAPPKGVAVDVKTLVAEAENAKGVIESAPQVGDFVGLGEPLFVLYGGAGVIDERKLQMSVFTGRRTCRSHAGCAQ